MGNSGSAHNLHIEGVSSELNSFYQQRRRVTKKQLYSLSNETSTMLGRQKEANIDWTMSLPHSMATGVTTRPKSGFEADLPKQFKVLPHLSERHKLRSTTNGAILHSGGTISGRKELKGDDEQSVLVPHQPQNQYNVYQTQIATAMQQRSRSFILESKRDICTASNQEVKKEAQPPPVFRRARTLLHFNHHGGSASDDKQRVNRSSYPSSTTEHAATTSDVSIVGALQHARSEADFHVISHNMIPARDDEPQRIKCSVSKLNKYNKKRKAPPAPALASVTHQSSKSTEATATIIPTTGQGLCSSSRTACKADERTSTPRMKSRLFRTNVKAYTLVQQQLQLQRKETLQPQQPQSFSFHRSTTLRASTTSSNSGYKLKSAPLLPLRREKSSDAILLRSNRSCAIAKNAKELLIPPVAVINEHRASKEAFSRQLSSHIGKTASRIPQLKRTFYFGMNAFRSDVGKDPSGRAEVVHQIQQQQQRRRSCSRDDLNRTANKVENAGGAFVNATDSSACRSPLIQFNDVQQKQMHSDATIGASPIDIELVVSSNNLDGLGAIYDIDKRSCEEDIEDNGLFVHVRPTLPRRQLETPSFSPAAAWRMLVDLPTNQQPLRTLLLPHRNPNTPVAKPASAITSDDFVTAAETIQSNGTLKEEPPIRIASTIKMRLSHPNNEATIKTDASAWTPQQDLDDEEDEYNENGDKNADDDKIFQNDFNVNENHIKNERDSSMFFGFKSKLKSQVSTYTPSASMHVFSLSLPRDAHTQPHVKSISNGKMRGFNSLQKLKCSSGSSGKNNVVSAEGALAVVCEFRGTDNICGGDSVHYRSDNWVLHHRTSKNGSSEENKPVAMSPSQGKWEALPSIKPISLFTGGKHVIYLPGSSSASNNNKTGDNSMLGSGHKRQPNNNKEIDVPLRREETQRKREARIVLQSLQDETPTPNKLHYRQSYNQQQATNAHLFKDGAPVGEKPQRYSFQSTVRLLEKRRLAEKLSKDAEIREAQRKIELEAMKRVEEDFQRKRAFEKASIRHQLRLYFSGGDGHDNDQFISLPLATKKGTSVCHQEVHQEQAKRDQQHDANNNDIFCRADPDGAVSSPSPTFPDALDLPSAYFMRSTTPTKRFDSDCGESDNEFDIASFKRTASLVEPYLQSIIK